MDPLYQTVLTICCMFGAYLWGRSQGVMSGCTMTWLVVIESFRAKELNIDEDTQEIFFTDNWGRVKSSLTFWNEDGNRDKEPEVLEQT